MRVGIHTTHRAAIAAGLLLAWASISAAGTGPGAASPHASPPARPAASAPAAKKPAPSPRLDLNSASKAQLMALPGLGAAEADKIIAHRPYLVSTEIVSKAGLPEGTYIALRRKIVALPPHTPKAPKKKAAAPS